MHQFTVKLRKTKKVTVENPKLLFFRYTDAIVHIYIGDKGVIMEQIKQRGVLILNRN